MEEARLEAQMAEAFRAIPYGVYLLAVRRGPDLFSLVVSWVSQASYSPPRLLVALRRNRTVIPPLKESGSFGLSLLSREQKALVAEAQALPSSSALAALWREEEPLGPPVLRNCLASFRCRLITAVEAGDHHLFLGEVEWASLEKTGRPLTTLDLGKTYIGQF